MRRLTKILAMLLAIAALWFTVWYFMLSADVARVKTTIEFQDAHFKTANRTMTLKAGSVGRTGFPFALRVRVTRPQLTMIWGDETYGVSAEWADLAAAGSGEGRYRLTFPPQMEAVFAKDGALPEQYFVSFTPMPSVLVRAAGNSNTCPPIGKACADVAAEAPLNAIAFALPSSLVMHVVRGGESRDAAFNPISAQIPIFMDIPADVSRPLVIAVNVLREALERPRQP